MAIQRDAVVAKNGEVEEIFNVALGNMLERFLMYSNGKEHLEFFWHMVVKTAFYSISTPNAIREFLNAEIVESVRGKKHAREMIDYLQSMMYEFRARMKVGSTMTYRELTLNLSSAYSEEGQPPAGTSAAQRMTTQAHSVLPEEQRVYGTEPSFVYALEQNGWYLALLMTRVFGMKTLAEYAQELTDEQRE